MSREETWLLKEKYNGTETKEFLVDCNRLAQGEPLAYVIGSTPFLGTIIYLDSHPLIPRPETEFWTEKVIQEMQNYESLQVLDLCAGSGCIGVAILKHVSKARVDFAEIYENHHTTILKNILENEIDGARTHIYGGSLFESLPSKQYDFILSNPPYIDPALDRTEQSVRDFEPKEALYGGDRGTALIFQIIERAPEYLTPEGILYIEHEPEQHEAIAQSATQNNLEAVAHPDQFGVIRYTRLTRKK